MHRVVSSGIMIYLCDRHRRVTALLCRFEATHSASRISSVSHNLTYHMFNIGTIDDWNRRQVYYHIVRMRHFTIWSERYNMMPDDSIEEIINCNQLIICHSRHSVAEPFNPRKTKSCDK